MTDSLLPDDKPDKLHAPHEIQGVAIPYSAYAIFAEHPCLAPVKKDRTLTIRAQ